MAYACEICDKKPTAGFQISHSRKSTKRRFLPNLQKIRVNFSGTVRRAYICTSCIRSGKITKAV